MEVLVYFKRRKSHLKQKHAIKHADLLYVYPLVAKNNQAQTRSDSKKIFVGRCKIREEASLSEMDNWKFGQKERRFGSQRLWLP